MEVDPNPLTFSVDTVTSKKKKGETGRPLSTKTQHKNLIESKRKVKESASSAAENDTDSTVTSTITESINKKSVKVKLEKEDTEILQSAPKYSVIEQMETVKVKLEKEDTEILQSAPKYSVIEQMEIDINSSVVSETSEVEVKKKGRPKKVKRHYGFKKKSETESPQKTDIEFLFTNKDGSKL
uniref:Uncharacterized protein n=1 Tax=Panagrolaimus superbus TaxID=310955 RepID=A0A914YSL7_9BILA